MKIEKIANIENKGKFEEPLYEVVHIAAEDIICTSGDDYTNDEL